LALVQSGHPKDAIDHLKRAASDPTLSSEARYLLGVAYFSLADYANAVSELQDLTEGSRADHVLFILEESNRLLARVKEARQYFVKLNRGFPDSPWLHYLLGAAYENQSEPEKALSEYKLALSRDPHQPNASFAIGYLYWRQQDYEAAKPWLEKELSNQACHAPAAFYLGEIARTGLDLQTGARLYRKAIECDPGMANAHLRLGTVLAETNQNQEALQELLRAAELDPQNPAPHYRLALVYKKLGRTTEASSEYDIVSRLQAAKR
jgi:tetratricopeptide (TPR) repeat protein